MRLPSLSFKALAMLGVTLVWIQGAFASGLAPDPKTCMDCHSDIVTEEQYGSSVHGQNACTSCHVEITDLQAHEEGMVKPKEVACGRCHQPEASEHASSVHMTNGIGCTECHGDIHAHKSTGGQKIKVVEKCMECHEADGYLESVHGSAVAGGNNDGASCNDCHQLHAVRPIHQGESREARAFMTESCLGCHEDEEKMARNGVTVHAVETFLESYHGKSYHLGFPELSAGCADCHGAHNVLPRSEAGSAINGDNLVDTCGQCHVKATAQFAKFYAHGNHSDHSNYPILWWTFIGMTGLLVGTFAVFWIHTLLWMFRGFVENREKQRALALAAEHGSASASLYLGQASPTAGAALDPGNLHAGATAEGILNLPKHGELSDGHKLYRRFEKRHIFLHLTVIISFLGLSLTGLPLKFSDQEWAKTMMSFYGGVHYAGLIHRGCAILTFYYFFGAILMSIDFLFVRKDVLTPSGHRAHWIQRLFGPDSLMPNLRDLQDVRNMVRWFFFRGPKPTFERWTYWEKFDFLAVFWGMFAIGGSGLLLWFPELFGKFLPGWMFNVATIVHSDEALLATGFIFTVHFFNTHGRPEKFPMDFVIFNGQMTKEEFVEERGDQWKRYKDLGITEQFSVRKPSGVLYDFFFKGFGFLAFFTGLGLAFLMLLAFLKG